MYLRQLGFDVCLVFISFHSLRGRSFLVSRRNGRTPASASYTPPGRSRNGGHVRTFLTSSSLSLSLLKVTILLLCLGRFQSITCSLSRHVYISRPGQEQTSQHHQVNPSSKIRVLARKPSPTASSATTFQDSSSRKVTYNDPVNEVGYG